MALYSQIQYIQIVIIECKNYFALNRGGYEGLGVYYRWQKQLFENGAAAFEHSRDTEQQKLERQVASLKSKIEQKNEVVAELMQEHVALKKSIGEI